MKYLLLSLALCGCAGPEMQLTRHEIEIATREAYDQGYWRGRADGERNGFRDGYSVRGSVQSIVDGIEDRFPKNRFEDAGRRAAEETNRIFSDGNGGSIDTAKIRAEP